MDQFSPLIITHCWLSRVTVVRLRKRVLNLATSVKDNKCSYKYFNSKEGSRKISILYWMGRGKYS